MDYLYLDQWREGFKIPSSRGWLLSEFAQAFPIKNKIGRGATDLQFNKYFLDFGFLKRILHDKGKWDGNKLFQRLSGITGIRPSPTTNYHPMGNVWDNEQNNLSPKMFQI